MSTAKRRVFNREVKLSAVERLLAGESAGQIAQELEVGHPLIQYPAGYGFSVGCLNGFSDDRKSRRGRLHCKQ